MDQQQTLRRFQENYILKQTYDNLRQMNKNLEQRLIMKNEELKSM